MLTVGGCGGTPTGQTGQVKDPILDQALSKTRTLNSVNYRGELTVGDQISANYRGTTVFGDQKQYFYAMELGSNEEQGHNNMTLEMFLNDNAVYVKDPFGDKWKGMRFTLSLDC